MNDIEQWLSDGGSFADGRKLYNAYAPRYRANRAVAFQINTAENSLSSEVLEEELTAIVAIIRAARPDATVKHTAKYHTRGDIAGFPPDLKVLDQAIPKYFKNRDFHRYRARDLPSGPSLREAAHEAVRYDLMIRDAYRVLDFYARTGTYPPNYLPPDETEKTRIEQLTFWLRAMKSYPSFISRNRKNEARKHEVDTKQKVLDEINAYLLADES